MMTNEHEARVAELKAAIAATATSAGGAPREVRVAAVELKKELRRAGTAAFSFAGALGVHVSTLCRWEREVGSAKRSAAPRGKQRRGSGFRMVEVVEPLAKRVQAGSAPVPAARGLRVAHGPSGLVVDGLDVETLAALLRRMS